MLSLIRRFACNSSKTVESKSYADSEEIKSVDSIPEFRHRCVEADFELFDVLGFPGSYGEVVSAQDRDTRTACAIKIMKSCHVVAKSVDSEIEIMKQLDHVNIIGTKAIYRDKKRVCIVMEKCGGGDLFDAVQERRFRSERHVAAVVRQILHGLKYIHASEIVHCDIKLANILLQDDTSKPDVKIIDFGVSQMMCGKKLKSSPVGSPSFIAPEVLEGCYDEKADIWSLGVVVFIMLFGFNPFNPKAKSALKYRSRINAHIKKGFCNKTKKGRGAFFPATIRTSDAARDFISKLLVSDPEDRMSAEEALKHEWIDRTLN